MPDPFADVDFLVIGVVPLAVAVAMLLALAAVLRRAVRRRSIAGATADNSASIDYTMAATAILALLGVLWQALPIRFMPGLRLGKPSVPAVPLLTLYRLQGFKSADKAWRH